MSEIKPRPSIMSYGAEPAGLPKKINRLEVYSTKRKKYQIWKPKYDRHTLALCDDGVYEIFMPGHKQHPPLFGGHHESEQQ